MLITIIIDSICLNFSWFANLGQIHEFLMRKQERFEVSTINKDSLDEKKKKYKKNLNVSRGSHVLWK